MRHNKKIYEIFPEYFIGGGIFGALKGLGVPWGETLDATTLDIEYIGNHSGDKPISRLLERLLERTGADVLRLTDIIQIATLLKALYGQQWEKLWNTLFFEYDPILNYDSTEKLIDDITTDEYGKTQTHTTTSNDKNKLSEKTIYGHSTTRTDDLRDIRSGSESDTQTNSSTRTDNLVETESGSNDETTTTDTDKSTTRQIAGYNADTYENSEREIVDESGSETKKETHNSTTQNSGTQSTSEEGEDTHTYNNVNDTHTGTQKNEESGEDTHETESDASHTHEDHSIDGGADTRTHSYTLTRKGNIGVTTSQQMIQSERELWMWNFFRNVVFPDLDRELTLTIYE